MYVPRLGVDSAGVVVVMERMVVVGANANVVAARRDSRRSFMMNLFMVNVALIEVGNSW